jgi:hypothetical protein
MLFLRFRLPYGRARLLAAALGESHTVLDCFDQGRLAIKSGFAATVADLKSQTFSESKRRE